MRKKLYKCFWVWDFDKEEKWLNEMAAKGLLLSSISFCAYTFDESIPGDYNIRLELLENLPTHIESQAYIKFIEDTGAEHLGSVMRWVYFRKKKINGDFELFSDYSSRIKHLNRMLVLMAVIIMMQLTSGIGIILHHFNPDSTYSVFMGIVSLTCAAWLCLGIFKINNKKQKLKKEQRLFE